MPPPSDLDLRPGERHRTPETDEYLPEVRFSEAVRGRFEYTHPMGGRAMVGIARIVKVGLPMRCQLLGSTAAVLGDCGFGLEEDDDFGWHL
jgi:hypothetical protein